MKQTRHFDLNQEHSVTKGFPAWIFPINHTSDFVNNSMMVMTSEVVSLVQEGVRLISFETLNSKYVGVFK